MEGDVNRSIRNKSKKKKALLLILISLTVLSAIIAIPTALILQSKYEGLFTINICVKSYSSHLGTQNLTKNHAIKLKYIQHISYF